MTIKQDYKNFVSAKVPVSRGSVQSIKGNVLVVVSKAGRKEFSVPDPSQYQIGDQVKFQGETFLGKLPPLSATSFVVV